MHEREINLLDFARLELCGERLMGQIRTRNDHDAAGFAIKAVNDAWANVPIDAGKSSEMVEQRIDQRAVAVPGTGVHHHARRFIHHHDVVILIEDFEWQFFRLGLECRKTNGRECHCVAGTQNVRGPTRRGVDLNTVLLDPAL